MLRPQARTLLRSLRLLPGRFAFLLTALLMLCTTVTGVAEKTTPRRQKVPDAQARVLARAYAQRAERLGLGTVQAAAKLLQGRPDSSWVRAAGPDRWLGALRLPLSGGHVSRGFGTGKGGYHQAVDIAAALGSTIRTAAPGIVGYADNDISGYGNLVIVIHPGGFVTTYAHNQKLLVLAGQQVKRSQPIAELGSTGRSMGPHLHIELLWNGLSCDPLPLFRPAARSKSGAPATAQVSLWKEPHKKPKSIRCGVRKHHPDYAKTSVDVDADDDQTP